MILITGAGGFLGSFLVEEFLRHGFGVRAMVRRKSDFSYLKSAGAEIVFADITNVCQVKDALRGVKEVIHAAALLGGRGKGRQDFLRVNYEATKALADLCVEQKIKRFTFISSITAVGPAVNKESLLDENSRFDTVSAYGESKRLAEEYLLSLFKKKELDVVIVRPALIYGPRDKRCAANYFRIANLGFFPLPATAADNKASFIYISDAAKAVFLAHTQSPAGEIYMLGNDVATVEEFIKKLLLVKGGFSLLVPIPHFLVNTTAFICGLICRIVGGLSGINNRIKNIGRGNWAVDNSKIKRMLGFVPQVDLREGLEKTWSFYSKHKSLLRIKYLLKNP